MVATANTVVENPGESAAPVGGGGFAEWVMIAVNGLRLKLGTSYRETYDLLSEMPGVLAERGLVHLPSYVTIYNWFKRIPARPSVGTPPSTSLASIVTGPAATTPNVLTTATAPCR